MAQHEGAGKRVVSPALVGRAAELGSIGRAVSAPPAVVIVDGEAGIGKTRLVTELAERPEVDGRRMLVGRCHRIRESFPLGPVIEALRCLGPDLAGGGRSPVVGALRPLLPEVADLLPPAPMSLDDRVAERHRVFRAMVEVLESLGPVVLVLEDLHWADEQTADFVGYVLSEAPAELAVVLTFRGDEVDPRMRSSTAKLPASMSRTDLVLRPLDEQETGALAAAIVGANHVSAEFAAYLRKRTSGLPFAIEELLALLRAQGKLVRRGGAWARRALDELDVPTGIRDPVLERVGRLSAAARSVAEAAAVLQLPVPVEALVATCRTPRELALPAVEEALESGLLAEHGEAIGFRHLLAAQAVYEEIPGPRQRDVHARAAAALGSVAPVPLGQVAHHLRHAGRLEDWVGAAERAAEQALELGNDAEAFRVLEHVLRQAPLDPERRGRLAVRLGQAAIEALRAREVLDLLSAVLEQDLPEGVRGELRFQVGLLLHDVGDDPIRVRQLLAVAVEELSDRPDRQAWAMAVLGIPAAAGIDIEEHRRWLRRALEIVPSVDDPIFEVFLLGKVAMVMTPIGDHAWRSLTDRIEERTGGAPKHRREVNAFWSVGTEACYAGHHQTSQRLLSAGLAGAVAGENSRLELSIRSAIALLDYCRGRWDGLAHQVEILVSELAEHPRARIDGEVVAGCLALVRGELDGARHQLTSAMDQCFELGGFDVLPVAMGALIRLTLARGEAESAMAAADRWLATVDSKGVWAPDTRVLPAVTEALLTAGRVSEARSLVARCTRTLRDLDAPLAPAALRHADGLLERAAGQQRAAAQHFATAADRYERLGSPYESALAAEQAALCLFAAGDDRQAGAQLLAALSDFRRLNTAWDSGRAKQVARRYGVSVPAHHRGGRHGYGNELSPREREVAELAATGRSNKEIAAELFLSVSTVARHISAAMRKLDARSRAALAHRLAEGPDDQN